VERGKENVAEESEDMIETRIVLISPDSDVTPEQLKSRALMLINEMRSVDIRMKETCYGILLEGDAGKLRRIIEDLRALDKNGIFSKVRGFPIGDKRVCRATRKGGPRPGFHQLEYEYKLLPRVRRALDLLEQGK